MFLCQVYGAFADDAIGIKETTKIENPDDELRKAAERGEPSAQYQLGNFYDQGDAVKWYQRAAEQGTAKAQASSAEAIKWYRKAAEQGYAKAQTRLGKIYTYGIGTPQDYAEGIKWYRKAAAQGDEEAVQFINVAADVSKVVKETKIVNDNNDIQSIRLLAEKGNPAAQYRIANAFSTGDGIKQSDSEAFYWMAKSAKHGYEKAQFQYAIMLKEGKGCKKDIKEASVWLAKAVENGNKEAIIYSENEKSKKKLAANADYIKYVLQPMCNTIGEADACGINTGTAKGAVISMMKNAITKDVSGFYTDAMMIYKVQEAACETGYELSYKVQIAKNNDCKNIKKEFKEVLKSIKNDNSSKIKKTTNAKY